MSKTQLAVSTSTAKKKNFGPQKDESTYLKSHQELAFEIEFLYTYACLLEHLLVNRPFQNKRYSDFSSFEVSVTQVESTQFEASKVSSMCIAKWFVIFKHEWLL